MEIPNQDDARRVARFDQLSDKVAYHEAERRDAQFNGDRGFLYEIDHVAPLPIGSELKIHRQSTLAADGTHLIEVSGVRMVRDVQALPGYRLRVLGPTKDYESFTVGYSDPTFRIIGPVMKVLKRGR